VTKRGLGFRGHLLAGVVGEGGTVDENGAVSDANSSGAEAFVVHEGGVQDCKVGARLGSYGPCR
jgi:hypothetical protein